MAYSLSTASAIDQLLQQDIDLESAFDILNVPQDERSNYQISDQGAFVVPRTLQITQEPAAQPADGVAAQNQRELNRVQTQAPAPQPPTVITGTPYDDDGFLNPGWIIGSNGQPVYVGGNTVDPGTAASAAGSLQAATLARAKEQATLQQRYNQTTTGTDWRVRLRLAPGADYLYKARPVPGILLPLVASDGVIFPYTPTLSTQYIANYDRKDLVHSNYRGYFYRNSAVNDITINGTFTAQDTQEAAYLLAVIHFFRSATKMFYGKDQQRGSPPPLVELSGYGMFQFNNHPCLISNFNYTLPNNVDYIRVTANNEGLNIGATQPKVGTSPVSTIEGALNRISSLVNLATGQGVSPGAQNQPVDLGYSTGSISGTQQTTYVPTKIEIQITLLPVQTRSQVSQQFSLANFANGNLLRGGFW